MSIPYALARLRAERALVLAHPAEAAELRIALGFAAGTVELVRRHRDEYRSPYRDAVETDATLRVERRQVTMIVPVIAGWIVHRKSYVPGAGAVASPVSPAGSGTATSVSFTVKLWGLAPPFATEMVDPEATEKQFGLNAKSLTVSVPVSLVAFWDVQSLPPPPPQAAPVSASTTTVARRAFVMEFPSVGCSGILVDPADRTPEKASSRRPRMPPTRPSALAFARHHSKARAAFRAWRRRTA